MTTTKKYPEYRMANWSVWVKGNVLIFPQTHYIYLVLDVQNATDSNFVNKVRCKQITFLNEDGRIYKTLIYEDETLDVELLEI